MTAKCRCYCGCDRTDQQLNDETSSDVTCRLCFLMDRHVTQHPNLTERVGDLEWHVRKMQERAGIPIAERIPKVGG